MTIEQNRLRSLPNNVDAEYCPEGDQAAVGALNLFRREIKVMKLSRVIDAESSLVTFGHVVVFTRRWFLHSFSE